MKKLFMILVFLLGIFAGYFIVKANNNRIHVIEETLYSSKYLFTTIVYQIVYDSKTNSAYLVVISDNGTAITKMNN
jgi:hypothetical protein